LVFQVNDLLNLTEAEDSDFDVHEDNVDLKSMIIEVIASFKSGSSQDQVDIELEEDEAVPTVVRCDPSMFTTGHVQFVNQRDRAFQRTSCLH
jgi:signal transduction histidine kinase